MNIRFYFIFIIICLIRTSVSGKTIEVGPSSSIKSIKTALASANECDTILVNKGTYKEGNLVIDKSVSIIGIDFPVLDGDGKTEIMTVTAHHVSIQGLQFQNVGTSYMEDRAAIRVQKASDFLIKDNLLLNTFFGIYLEHSRNGQIINNRIIGEAVEEMSSGNAIHLWYCKNILIESNEVSNHRDGIYLEFVSNSRIVDNRSEYNLRYGLHFMFSNHNDFYKNIFQRNGSGVAVMFSKHINMWENVFQKNWGQSSYGILLKEIYDTEIKSNLFLENTMAIYVEGSSRVRYTDNVIEKNGWAVKITGGCLDNELRNNNFIGNTFDLSVSQNMNNNSFDGNYWSEYNGYDLDKDGIGDVPYRPVKLFNYIVNQTPETLVLMRSLFVDLLNFSEKVSPVFTPDNVMDNKPLVSLITMTNYAAN